MCCIWPSIRLYLINYHDAISRSTLEDALICVLLVKVRLVQVSRIRELNIEVWLVVCRL